MTVFFTKDNGIKIPVDHDKFLAAALNPTSQGTNYWDPPPAAPISDRQTGRILLQVHQILDVFKSSGISLSGKKFLDIGTGNGMVPKLMLELSELNEAVGTDPFLDGEHKTSWQVHDHEEGVRRIRSFIDRFPSESLDLEYYKQYISHENMTFIPQPIPLPSRKSKSYRFSQVGAHDLPTLGEKFDILYCKAIEHIHDWDLVFHSASKSISNEGSFYLKHRSFFSYLGPHRYSSIDIPWGHVLLSDSEYRRYLQEFHLERSESMCDFYFNGLSYPRNTVGEMVKIASMHGFSLQGIKYEPPRYAKKVFKYANIIDNFWEIVHENYPRLGADELFSGMTHILFKKA